MGFVLTYLQGLKLSIQGWIVVTLVALIGALVGLLKLQGSRLHAAQVALLASELKARQDRDDATVEAARKRYEEARRALEEGK